MYPCDAENFANGSHQRQTRYSALCLTRNLRVRICIFVHEQLSNGHGLQFRENFYLPLLKRLCFITTGSNCYFELLLYVFFLFFFLVVELIHEWAKKIPLRITLHSKIAWSGASWSRFIFLVSMCFNLCTFSWFCCFISCVRVLLRVYRWSVSQHIISFSGLSVRIHANDPPHLDVIFEGDAAVAPVYTKPFKVMYVCIWTCVYDVVNA